VNAELVEAKKRWTNMHGPSRRRWRKGRPSFGRPGELILFSRDLETKVKAQVEQIRNYNELMRYLSPNIAEKILANRGSSAPSHRER